MGSLAKVFYSPTEVFQGVDESPHWVMPFLTVLVLTLILTAVLLPTVIQPNAIETARSRLGGAEEQMEGAFKFIGGSGFYAVTLVSAGFGSALKIIAQAGIFALLLLLLGGEVNFRKILGVTAYSGVIGAVGGFVTGGIMIATKSLQAATNLSLFAPGLEKKTFLFKFLSGVDFFTIWSLLLFALGLSVVGKIDKRKSYILVFLLWFVLIAVFSLVPGIKGRFGG